jgi:hypothetical protein
MRLGGAIVLCTLCLVHHAWALSTSGAHRAGLELSGTIEIPILLFITICRLCTSRAVKVSNHGRLFAASYR